MKNKQLKHRSITKSFTRAKIKTDAKMKFHTEISTIVLLNKIQFIGRDQSMQKTLAKSGIEDAILLRNGVSVISFSSH